jgi:HAD superfamily hydrolase (TIGR01509 family)
MTVKGLIFDFDGLILDTELPVYQSWQEIYRSYGLNLPFEEYAKCIGSTNIIFDPLAHLARQLAFEIDGRILRQRQQERELQLLAGQAILPGVEKILSEAKKRSLPCAIASSSDRHWIEWNLERIGLKPYFSVVITADEVKHVKPHPDLFLEALAGLHRKPEEVIGFEDSPNGIAAAKSAGIWIIGIPNPLTRQLDLSRADRVYNSMADIDLPQLLALAERSGTNNS